MTPESSSWAVGGGRGRPRDPWPVRWGLTLAAVSVVGLLVVNTKFLKVHPDLVKNWIRANVELTDWINAHQGEAKKLLNDQIQRETGKALPAVVLDEAFSRIQVTYDPLQKALMTAAQQAFEGGFLGRKIPDLSRLYDLGLLNQVLAEKGRKAIQ